MTERAEQKRNTGVHPGDILLAADEIAGIVERLGSRISTDYEGRHPILINLLKGGVVFLADLIRKITIPHHIEFMGVSSYENGTLSSGNVRILEDLTRSVEGRDVIVVEDVIDTGTTLAYILNMLRLRNPRSVEVCALLRKTSVPGQAPVPVRYIGREIPNVFVVGYGLDYDENYRHLPHIARLECGGDRE
jgi:hypoxanthine phosphoribosyltransferase